jgi:hypothetical protein
VICAKPFHITVYQDGSYRGGDYFGRMPELRLRKRPQHNDPAVAEEIWKHSDEYWECLRCSRMGGPAKRALKGCRDTALLKSARANKETSGITIDEYRRRRGL